MRPQKIRLGPCRQLSSLFIAPTTSLKRDFDILKYHQQMHNASSAYEGDVTEVFEDHREVQIDGYETDSNYEESDFEKHPKLVNRPCVPRSGRAVRVFVRLHM